jgi:hypothetical protein
MFFMMLEVYRLWSPRFPSVDSRKLHNKMEFGVLMNIGSHVLRVLSLAFCKEVSALVRRRLTRRPLRSPKSLLQHTGDRTGRLRRATAGTLEKECCSRSSAGAVWVFYLQDLSAPRDWCSGGITIEHWNSLHTYDWVANLFIMYICAVPNCLLVCKSEVLAKSWNIFSCRKVLHKRKILDDDW